MTAFFSQPTLDAFYEKRSPNVGQKRIVTIDKSIVDVILSELLLGRIENEDEAEDQQGSNNGGLKPGDRRLQVFVLRYVMLDDGLQDVLYYTVKIVNVLQFVYVVSFLGAGLSFR
jgi:hypothetical protein